jgi:hypothetical protein
MTTLRPSTAILHGKRVDVTPLFRRCQIPTAHLEIIETPGMYPYKEKIEDNWAYFTAVGMKRLKEMLDAEHQTVQRIGIVGICSGVEGIAVEHIFQDTLKELIVTDVDEEILRGTVTNIQNTAPHAGIHITPLLGSFCEPLEQARITVDVVHANIPNLPAHGDEDLSRGAEKGTFLPEQLYDPYHPPREFVEWALAAQYAYLMSAKKVIQSGGTIMTELGGRMPLEIVRNLFDACGLRLEEVIVGFKEQTEALIDFEGYHALETKYGVSFEFYRSEESKDALHQEGIENPTPAHLAQEIKTLLEPFRVSAGEALTLYHQQVPVGHTVHLFRGVK